jgi:hypothetical protein
MFNGLQQQRFWCSAMHSGGGFRRAVATPSVARALAKAEASNASGLRLKQNWENALWFR